MHALGTRSGRRPRQGSAFLFLLLSWTPAAGQAPQQGVPGGALQIIGQDGAVAGACPLKHTEVRADIAGFVGRTTVRQIFHNPTDRKIEAVYVFPLPRDAAVDSMVMTVGDRRVLGQIKPRDEAREIYEAARQAGRVAGLLDQERPNIFTQSVANIEPGVEVVIEIAYVETLRYEEGRFEWVFPMVVGPRYIPGGGSARAPMTKGQDTPQVPDASKITPPVTPEGTRAGHDISLRVSIDGGSVEMAPFDVESELHEIVTTPARCPGCVMVELKDRAEIPTRDFVLRYRIGSEDIGDSVLMHRDDRGEFMTLILQPPRRVVPEQLVNRELVFVLDTSGSMSGFPIEKARETMSKLIDTMQEGDTFNVITFAGQTRILWPEPRPNTPENRAEAQALLAKQKGGGGTEMMKAIEAALKPTERADHKGSLNGVGGGDIEGVMASVVAALPNMYPRGQRVRVLVEWTRYEIDEQADRTWLLLPDGERVAATRFRIESGGITCRTGETLLLEGTWRRDGDSALLDVESARFASAAEKTRPWLAPAHLRHWVGDGSSVRVLIPATQVRPVLQDGAAPGVVDLPIGKDAIRAEILHWELREGSFQPRPGQWVELRGAWMKRNGDERAFVVDRAVWPLRPSATSGEFLPPGVRCVEETAEILYEPADSERPYDRRIAADSPGGGPPVSEPLTVEGRWSSDRPVTAMSASGTSEQYLLSNDGTVALAVTTLRADLRKPEDGQYVRLTGRVAMTAVGSVLQAEDVEPLPVERVASYTPDELATTPAEGRVVRLLVPASRCVAWPPPNCRSSWTGLQVRTSEGVPIDIPLESWRARPILEGEDDTTLLFEGRWRKHHYAHHRLSLEPIGIWSSLWPQPEPTAPIRVVCFMTDGYVGNDMAIIDAVKKYADTARVFSFGIGNSVNRYLLDGIAHAGRGEAEYVTLASQAEAAVERFHERILAPVLTDITIDWGDLPITDVYPRRIPDLFAAQPIMLHGRIDRAANGPNGPAGGDAAANVPPEIAGTITLRGNTGAGPFDRAIEIRPEQFSPRDAFAADNPTLPSLWARAKVADLMNQDLAALQQGTFPEPLKSQITNLGVEFNLMTQFTSFVAVEEMTVTVGGEPVRIEVPVEMPSGVSYEGVFGEPVQAGFAVGGALRAAPAQAAGKAPAARRLEVQRAGRAGQLFQDDESEEATPTTPTEPRDKLAEPLRDLAEKVAKEGAEGNLTVSRMKVVDHRLDVIVTLSDTSAATRKALITLGFKQTGESKAARLLIGSIDVRKLAELAKLDAVISVRPVIAP